MGEAANTNFIVFDVAAPGLHYTICRSRGVKYYTTDVV